MIRLRSIALHAADALREEVGEVVHALEVAAESGARVPLRGLCRILVDAVAVLVRNADGARGGGKTAFCGAAQST